MKLSFEIFLFVILPISFFIFVGWFFKKNPFEGTKSTNVFDQFKAFRKRYPGFKGGVIFYGFFLIFSLLLLVKIYNVFYGVR